SYALKTSSRLAQNLLGHNTRQGGRNEHTNACIACNACNDCNDGDQAASRYGPEYFGLPISMGPLRRVHRVPLRNGRASQVSGAFILAADTRPLRSRCTGTRGLISGWFSWGALFKMTGNYFSAQALLTSPEGTAVRYD